MPSQSNYTTQVSIKLNGTEVQNAIMQKLLSAVVDQHSHLPHMFTLRFSDPEMDLLDEGSFDLTDTVEIIANNPQDEQVTLIKGEITALEPIFDEGMIPYLVVRGYDKLHRLYRETKTMAHLNMKDSDLATQIAQSAQLQAEVETTNTVYDHIFQDNQADLSFLMQRAWRIGYECFVSEGKLFFRKPPTGGSALSLTWGEDLASFRPRMTLAEQVDEVTLKGWDVEKQEAIVGNAQSGNLYPSIEEPRDGKNWASSFGAGKKIIVDQPVVSQAEADEMATARLDEISGAFVQAEGVASRRPDIGAGKKVRLQGVGRRMSGTYLITSATHVYNPEGYKTYFTVSGSRTGLISDQVQNGQPVTVWPGVVIGIVTNTDDPNDWGRVKVKFPWMSADAESDWARVIGIGAANETGFYVIPAVGDEVVVAFGHGNFSQPVVLGGLWNGQSKIPTEAAQAGSGDKPRVRTWHSSTGHMIAVYDTDEKKIDIVTADGRTISLSDKDKKIIIKTSNVELVLEDSKMTIETGSDISLKASSNLTLEASGNLNIKANGNLDLNASGNVTVKGAMINLN
jgi:phage protein D/phage baseplate assembly protein gpV